jgi:hypothetical protein
MIRLYTIDENHNIELPGDEWFTDLSKVRPVVIRKSLDGTPYSYVQRERNQGTLYQRSVSFAHLDKERIAALRAFLEAAEGQLCVMEDGKGGLNLIQLVPDSIAITSTTRAARRDDQGNTVEDNWHQVTFKVQISLTETGLIV